MLNTQLLNQGLLWGWPTPAEVLPQDRFVFDWYSLSDCTTKRVVASNHDDIGDVQYDTYDAPRIDWGGVLGRYFRRKDINLTLSLSGGTEEGLNNLIDELKEKTRDVEWYLEIIINDEIRRVKATVTSLVFNRESFQLSFVSNVDITFSTMEPHFYAKTPESNTYNTITGDIIEEIDNEGTVETEAQLYFVFWPTVTGLSSIVITVGSQELSINETISGSDILIVDGEEKLVTLNGTLVDYDWVFPILDVGPNSIEFDFEAGATFTCDITEIHKKRYK